MPEEAPSLEVTAPLVEWNDEGSPRLMSPAPRIQQNLGYDEKVSSPAASDEVRREAPDGGWGWVIVLCSLTISLIQDGISFSFGLIYVELLREFGASMSKTSWVGALFLAVPLLAGPLASALVEKHGCRVMTIAGGIISALGFVASALFGTSIEMLLLTFGLISGFGLAIGYVTAVVSVAYWFDKRLSLANGIGVSGTGIGTFLLPPLTQVCLNEYGWRGTSLLLAGAFLQMCICGAAMRDPEWLQRKNKKNNNNNNIKSDNIFNSINYNHNADIAEVKYEYCNKVSPLLIRKIVQKSPSPIPESIRHSQHRHSLTYRGALVRLSPPWTSGASDETPDDGRAISCPDLQAVMIELPTPTPIPPSNKPSILSLVLASLDVSLFCDRAFFLLAASTLLLYTWVIVPYLYLAEHMIRHGYSDTDTSLVIAIIGVPNTIAMVLLGWAGDKAWMPVAKTYGVCLIISGISTLVMPLVVASFSSLAASAALFGLSLASNYSFTPVLVLQLVALDRFTSAYGLVLLVQGVGNLIGPPLAGFVFDLTGTWDLSFYLAGIFIVISGVLALLIAFCPSTRKEQINNSTNNN